MTRGPRIFYSEPIETGNLLAELAADGRRTSGRLRMKRGQAERAATLTRRQR